MNVAVVDLFCGAGGLTHGFVTERLNVVAGIDLDPSCRHAYERNNSGARFVHKDIAALAPADLDALFPEDHTRVLAGCAPCQPFSTYTQGKEPSGDHRWGLLYSFSRLVEGILPEVVTMENVPLLRKRRVFDDFVDTLKRLGYHIWCDVVFCPDYGVPQTRRRLVLLASRLGPIALEPATHRPETYVKVRDRIGGCEPLNAGEASKKDPVHVAARLSATNLRRIQSSIPGGTWRDWDDSLVAGCHLRKSGRTYPGVYGRMAWDQPGPTMTTECYAFGSGRFGHPIQDRAITLREAALLQTFPDTYEFVEPGEKVYIKTLGRLIGNAVPVNLARAIARSISEHLGIEKLVAT